jgi:hypothetical protein
MAATPQPAPTPKKGHLLRNIGLGCGGLIVLFIIIAIATNAGKTASPSSSPAAADKGSASASAASTPAHVAQVLLDVTGTGIKSTNKFTTSGDWDLNWSYDCSNFGSSGNFSVVLYGQNSSDMKGIPVNELGAKGADVSHQHDAGTFYLEMNSECAWHVTVKG